MVHVPRLRTGEFDFWRAFGGAVLLCFCYVVLVLLCLCCCACVMFGLEGGHVVSCKGKGVSWKRREVQGEGVVDLARAMTMMMILRVGWCEWEY